MSVALFHFEHGSIDAVDKVLGNRTKTVPMFAGDCPWRYEGIKQGPDALPPQVGQCVHIVWYACVAGNEQRPRWISVHEIVQNEVDFVDFPLQFCGEPCACSLAFRRIAQLVRDAVSAHAQAAGVVDRRRGALQLP